MKYKVNYVLTDSELDKQKIGEIFVDDPVESVELLNDKIRPKGSIFVYNSTSCEQLNIEIQSNIFLVRDLMSNGFYEKTCDYDGLIEILEYFKDPSRNPLTYGMKSFG